MSEANESELPAIEVQRRILEEKRDQFRAQGFVYELEIATLKVQKCAGSEEERQRGKMLSDLREKSHNCYESAKELTRLLTELPDKEVAGGESQ